MKAKQIFEMEYGKDSINIMSPNRIEIVEVLPNQVACEISYGSGIAPDTYIVGTSFAAKIPGTIGETTRLGAVSQCFSGRDYDRLLKQARDYIDEVRDLLVYENDEWVMLDWDEFDLRVAKGLWAQLADIPIDDDECIEEPFEHFDEGTPRLEIWHWFEEEYNLSVAKDLMGLTEEE